MLGRVKTIKPSLYGFILDENGVEYFFHSSNYNGDWEKLKEISPPAVPKGPIVQFQPVRSLKGWKAENVEFILD